MTFFFANFFKFEQKLDFYEVLASEKILGSAPPPPNPIFGGVPGEGGNFGSDGGQWPLIGQKSRPGGQIAKMPGKSKFWHCRPEKFKNFALRARKFQASFEIFLLKFEGFSKKSKSSWFSAKIQRF